MDELRIASRPLIELTVRSYESRLFALKLCKTIERDIVKIESLEQEIGELNEMISHANSVLKNQ